MKCLFVNNYGEMIPDGELDAFPEGILEMDIDSGDIIEECQRILTDDYSDVYFQRALIGNLYVTVVTADKAASIPHRMPTAFSKASDVYLDSKTGDTAVMMKQYYPVLGGSFLIFGCRPDGQAVDLTQQDIDYISEHTQLFNDYFNEGHSYLAVVDLEFVA